MLTFIFGATIFARVELGILTGTSTVFGLVLLLAVYAGLRLASLRGGEPPIDFDEAPATLHQLGLHE